MNKYQEALYIVTDWFHSYKDKNGVCVHEKHIDDNYLNAVTDLQELIDNYEKIEKALDKACELLELNSMKRTDAHVYMSKTKWKGWLLNDK